MNTPFQLLRNRATRMQELSEEWIQEQASFLRVTPQRFFQDTDRLTNRIILGRLYMFQYDPKLKESLDFYDTFPLVIPLKYDNKGFTGFNLHYLRPQSRAIILETLKEYLTGDRMSERTRINITWDRISRRLQLQERLTTQVANTLQKVLNPVGVAVVMEGRHLCMQMRGVEKQNSYASTSAMLGQFRNSAETRSEFLSIIGK